MLQQITVFGTGALAGLMVSGFLVVWLFLRRAVAETDAQEQAYTLGVDNVILKSDLRAVRETIVDRVDQLNDARKALAEAEHDVSNLLAQNEIQAALYRVRLQKSADERERIAYDRDELRELVAYLVWQRDKHRERAAFYCAQSHNPPTGEEEVRITSDFYGTYVEPKSETGT